MTVWPKYEYFLKSGWRDMATWETLTQNFDINSPNVVEGRMNDQTYVQTERRKLYTLWHKCQGYKNKEPWNNCCHHSKIWTVWFYYRSTPGRHRTNGKQYLYPEGAVSLKFYEKRFAQLNAAWNFSSAHKLHHMINVVSKWGLSFSASIFKTSIKLGYLNNFWKITIT